RDRIQENHHVALVLDQALRLLDHHLRYLNVTHGGLVEGRAHDLTLDRAGHISDLLRPLVDQKYDEIDLGVVKRDRMSDVLQHYGLARARRRHDEPALSLAEWRDEIDHARRQVLASGLSPVGVFRLR